MPITTICVECTKECKKSTCRIEMSETVWKTGDRYWNEDGVQITQKPIKVDRYWFVCSNGHHFQREKEV